jgi:hypothetical protein
LELNPESSLKESKYKAEYEMFKNKYNSEFEDFKMKVESPGKEDFEVYAPGQAK